VIGETPLSAVGLHQELCHISRAGKRNGRSSPGHSRPAVRPGLTCWAAWLPARGGPAVNYVPDLWHDFAVTVGGLAGADGHGRGAPAM